jgi:ketosteroid isomerase-like protein
MKPFCLAIMILSGVISFFSLFTSCAPKYGMKSYSKTEQDIKADALRTLREADRSWCQSASDFEGFMSFLDDDVVWYFCNFPALKDKDAVRSFYKKMYEDTAFTFTWTPDRIEVSVSGDIGYDYGTYKVISANSNEQQPGKINNYATIWRKQSNSTWRVVLEADF